jgi:T6SS, Phospholipase effector Tle1-like, catalytic domain
MRQLIVCCDGTWNTPEDESVTNVRRLFNALDETDEDGNVQWCYYQRGVGSEGGLLVRLSGGGLGVGLSSNVMAAYHWLTTRYEPGDRIALFGFSRGAYTARSLAGMISSCGLIDTANADEATTWRRIERAYSHYRRRAGNDQQWRAGLSFRYDPRYSDQIPIHFIGVWDTVGALGIPNYVGWLNLMDPFHRYDFHDLTLNPHIPHARQAMALDERRGPYQPALWAPPFPDGQDVKQVWFPGSHKDVGGGHLRMGLSDSALLWMIEEARDAVRLGFNKVTVEQIKPDPVDVLHDDDRGVVGVLEPLVDPLLKPWLEVFLQPRPRAVPRIDPQAKGTDIHRSVYERCQSPPITGGRYRPTRVLRPGQPETVDVFARDPWNDTGLYLEAGDYQFTAEGEWLDGTIPSGPAGTVGLRRFNPMTEKGRLLGRLASQVNGVFTFVTGNRDTEFVGAGREPDLPWMSLVGVVANGAVPVKGALTAHNRITIGSGTRYRVTKGGYLYAYANDAWGFYGNNYGSVRLTVTRTSAEEMRPPTPPPSRAAAPGAGPARASAAEGR